MPQPTPMPPNDTQDDIARAFSITSDRIFSRKNAQVYAIVGCNRESGVVSVVWFDVFDTQEEFRRVLKHILSLFRQGGFRYWLADMRYMTADFTDSEDWALGTFMPAMYEAGMVREAAVISQTALETDGHNVHKSASRMIASLAGGRVREFTEITEAKAWLLGGEQAADITPHTP